MIRIGECWKRIGGVDEELSRGRVNIKKGGQGEG